MQDKMTGTAEPANVERSAVVVVMRVNVPPRSARLARAAREVAAADRVTGPSASPLFDSLVFGQFRIGWPVLALVEVRVMTAPPLTCSSAGIPASLADTERGHAAPLLALFSSRYLP